MLEGLLLDYILKNFTQKNFYFKWPSRTKIQRMYQFFSKKVMTITHFLRCPDLQDNNFEVMCTSIALDNIDLECAETIKAKSTGNDSVFITY